MNSEKDKAPAPKFDSENDAPAVLVGTPPQVEARPGRHDAEYLADQAAQRRAPTRFDNRRFRRIEDAAKAKPAR